MRTSLAATVLLALTGALLPASASSVGAAVGAGASAAGPETRVEQRARPVPRLRVTTQVGGLDHPWDVQRLPGVGLLVGERDRAQLSVVRGNDRTVLDFPSERVWVSGETGLLGLAVDPRFADNRRVYACHGGFAGDGRHDVRVVAYRIDQEATRARQVDVLLRGIQATSGRHGGCRLLITRDGALVVGTGDAAVSSNPQDRTSLNGKVLRLDPRTGRPDPRNPYAAADNRKRRYVLTYGHRNVQGVAQRRDGTLWSVEHGPDRDDEVNLLRRGGNYGWDPDPGYDESVPMTDFSLPGPQRGARWSSGVPTVAPSGGYFIRGSEWGAYNGTLAVAVLKDQRMMFQRFDERGRFQGMRVPQALTTHGRLRAVTQLPNGTLLVTTDNGGGNDEILRVTPVGG